MTDRDTYREEVREEMAKEEVREARAEAEVQRARAEALEQDIDKERIRAAKDQRLASFKLTSFIWWLFGIIEGLIGLRVLLKMMAANPNNPFAAFLYGITEPLVFPFQGLTAEPAASGFVLELSSIIGMVVYALVAWALVKAIEVLLYRPRGTV